MNCVPGFVAPPNFLRGNNANPNANAKAGAVEGRRKSKSPLIGLFLWVAILLIY